MSLDKTMKKKKVIKAWSIVFLGDKMEKQGVCAWGTGSQLEIFEKWDEAKVRLADFPIVKETMKVIPVTITYHV